MTSQPSNPNVNEIFQVWFCHVYFRKYKSSRERERYGHGEGENERERDYKSEKERKNEGI